MGQFVIILIAVGGAYFLWESNLKKGSRFVEAKRVDKNLEICRKKVLNSLEYVLKTATEETNVVGDIWSLLLVDTQMSITSINEHPNNIPVIIMAVMNVGANSLDILSRSSASTEIEKKLLQRVRERYYNDLRHISCKLIEIHGHKLTDAEVQTSMDVINNL